MPMMDLLRWSGANRRVPGRSGRYLSAPANEVENGLCGFVNWCS